MKLNTAFFVLTLGLFGLGIAAVFAYRFEGGDIYPPMSTYRSDPDGARAFYDALGALPGVTVERNLHRELRPRAATAFVLGLPVYGVLPNAKEFEAFTRAGGRVVVGFLPVRNSGSVRKTQEEIGWGASVAARVKADAIARKAGEPREFAVSFTKLDPQWRVLKNDVGGPTVIERPLEKGSIVLAADPSLFTNAGLASSRNSELLAAIAGTNRQIIFDEHHLGITEHPGVALLMRRFHLEAVIAAILITACLFAWSVSAPFPPVRSVDDETTAVTGFDAASGLVRLLRRNISPAALVPACIAEWSQTAPAAAARVDQASALQHKDPVSFYRQVQSILEQHK